MILGMRSGVAGFSPRSLFINGEKGAIYDMSDKSSMWQDRVFASPVTASGQSASVVADRLVSPSTATARRNLLFGTNEPLCTAHTITGGGTATAQLTAGPDTSIPVIRLSEGSATSVHGRVRVYNHLGGVFTYTIPQAAAAERKYLVLSINLTAYVIFDLVAGTVFSTTGAVTGTLDAFPGNTWFRAWITGTLVAGNVSIGTYIADDLGVLSHTGDPLKGLLISGEQFEAASVPSLYQPVGNNIVGWVGGNIMACDTDAKCPVYTESGGLKFLRFNGTNSHLWADGFNLLTTGGVVTFGLAYRIITNATTAVPIGHGVSNSGTSGGRDIILPFGVNTSNPVAAMGESSTKNLGNSAGDDTGTPRTFVAVVTFDPMAATNATRVRIEINGYPATITQALAAGVLSAAAASSLIQMTLGARRAAVGGTASLFANGDMYGFVAINRLLTAAERTNLAGWLGARAGVSVYNGKSLVTYAPVPSDFSFTETPVAIAGGYRTSAFGAFAFDTTASVMVLNLRSTAANFEVGVFVDGVYVQSLVSTGAGTSSYSLRLPKIGSKRVQIVNSSWGVGINYSTLLSVQTDVAITPVVVTSSTRVLIYADSIHYAVSTTPQVNAHTMLLRAAGAALGTPATLTVDAYGGRSLFIDCPDASGRAAFIAKVVTANPTRMMLEIGVNDYINNSWTAANFGTAYAALLDDLHTALPSMTIDCVSPIIKLTETANGLGSTLGDYRTAISTAVSTRTGYCTYRDGSTVMTTASLSGDGVHPTNAGHILYYTAEKGWLGW